MRINQNIMAFNAYRNLSSTNGAMGKSLEKLSSGFRINRAADDAAGLVISQNLRAQVSGLKVATRNAQDGISVVQTAEGALNEVHNMLNRMRDLAVQAVNASNDPNAREAADNEITELKAEIGRIGTSTKFGEQNLLDGSFGLTPATSSAAVGSASHTVTAATNDTFEVTHGGNTYSVTLGAGAYSGSDLAAAIQNGIRADMLLAGESELAEKFSVTSSAAGAGFELEIEFALADTETFTVSGNASGAGQLEFAAPTAASGTAASFQVGANAGEVINIQSIDLTALDMTGDVTTSENAEAFITRMDAAIKAVSEHRGKLGAVQNRFESTIANLQVTTENLAASESRIRDTDMALEMVNFTRSNILQQAGTAMLAQANQLPQSVLRLLG